MIYKYYINISSPKSYLYKEYYFEVQFFCESKKKCVHIINDIDKLTQHSNGLVNIIDIL